MEYGADDVTTDFSPTTSPLSLEGVDAVPHPLLIEASAGSGKTWTLAHLSARLLIEEDVEPREILLVTFTRDAARQLRARVRQRLDDIVDAFERDDHSLNWMAPFHERWITGGSREEDMARARWARQRVDELDARTFHSFAAQRSTTLREGMGDPVPLLERAVREVVARWSHGHPEELAEFVEVAGESLAGRLATIYEVARALYDSGWSDSSDSSVVRVAAPDSGLTPQDRVARMQSHLAQETVRRARELARRMGRQSFSDVLSDLGERLDGPDGDRLTQELRSLYRVVMIDEFQDTDPLQWRIFERVFRGAARTRLIMVGDPKQAIYGFRSGGVDTYLSVRNSLGARGALVHLTENYRSTPRVVSGINDFFGGANLHYTVDDPEAGISYFPVRPVRPDVPRHALSSGADTSAVVFRFCSGGRDELVDDVVEVVRHLHGRGVGLRDIAILCRRNDECRRVLSRLRQAGVPAVSESSHSVLDTEAAFQVGQLVAALNEPDDVGLTHVLSLSWFRSVDEGDLLATLAQLRREVETTGVVSLVRFLRRPDVLRVVASSRDAERHLTDLAHLGELLARELSATSSLNLVDQWLNASMRHGDTALDDSARRLESDKDAVRILTVHRSKGLEFPYVLAPFFNYFPPRSTSTGPRALRRWVDGSTTVIDGGSGLSWGEDEGVERSLISDAQAAAEHRRLLYVTMTRAAEGFVGWYRANPSTPMRSETARMIFDRAVQRSGPWPVRARPFRDLAEITGAQNLRRREVESLEGFPQSLREYDDWVDAASKAPLTLAHYAFEGSAVRVEPLEPLVTELTTDEVTEIRWPLETREAPRREGRWRRWSYTSVTRRLSESDSGVVEDVPGADEPQLSSPDVEVSVATVFGTLSGRELGVGVHRVLELLLSAQSPDVSDAVRRAFTEITPERPLSESDREKTIEALGLIRHRRFSQWSDWSLNDFDPTTAIAEMRFTVGLGSPSPSRLRDLASYMGGVLAGGEFGEYFNSSKVSALDEGFLVGSLDAVLRTPDGKFRIVDYKTDQLAGARRPFDSVMLRRHMVEHHYPWQALFYSVALHRFLSERVSGYDPAHHLGGVDYYFVRVVGDPRAHDEDGLFTWNIPPEAVSEASRIMGEAR